MGGNRWRDEDEVRTLSSRTSCPHLNWEWLYDQGTSKGIVVCHSFSLLKVLLYISCAVVSDVSINFVVVAI